MAIHPLAVVHPTAQLGSDIEVGPFAIIEAGTIVGDRCVIDAHSIIKQGTSLGNDNHVYERAILGGLPQHVRMPEHVGTVTIGSGNTFRENVTVHRALHAGTATSIGDNNFVMVGVHVAHDCMIESNTIFANNVMLAGHVTVEDRAYLSGSVAVHQFCRVGRLAMIGGLARVTKDVPPFVTVDGGSSFVVGLNTVGLRRAGFKSHDIEQLKNAYRVIYRSGMKWQEVIDQLKAEFTSAPASYFAAFLPSAKRGVVPERRLPPGMGIKMGVEAAGDVQTFQAKAG